MACYALRPGCTIHELLDFVEDVVDGLGSSREMNYLRTLLNNSTGTGADRQIAAYQKNNDVNEVLALLIEQTMEGVELDQTDLSNDFLKFKMYETMGQEE